MVLLKDFVQVSQWICCYGKISSVELVSCQFIIQAALPGLHSVLLGRMLLGQEVDDFRFFGVLAGELALGMVDGNVGKERAELVAQDMLLW